MKQYVIKGVLFVCMILLCYGCGNKEIGQNAYDKVCAERDTLQANVVQLQTQVEQLNNGSFAVEEGAEPTIHTKIRGSFVATVRAVLPDYCLDDTTPQIAVLTCFQRSPFTVYVGKELATQLKVGETYTFQIEDKDIDPISEVEFSSGVPSLEIAIPLYQLRIGAIYDTKNYENGLDTATLTFEQYP